MRIVTALTLTQTLVVNDDTSEVSDLDKFEKAYKEFRDLTAGVDPSAFE